MGRKTSRRDGADFKTRFLGCCVNIGIGASVARYANRGIRKIVGDYIGTFLSMVRALLSYHPNSFQLCCNGRKEVIGNVHSISIGRTLYIA